MPPDTVVTVAVTVERHRPSPPHRPRAPYNIDTFDDTNTLTITYFNARQDYLEKLFPKGELRYVSGTATLYDGHLQMLHPDRVVDAEGFARLPLIDPVYPMTEGLHPNQVRKAVDLALERIPKLPEWQDAAWLARNRYPDFAGALRSISTVDALIALQGVENPTARKKRAVVKGRNALDVLDTLKLRLLDGSLDRSTLARLQVAAERLTEETGDPGLDTVLGEIDLRVAVELTKAGIR